MTEGTKSYEDYSTHWPLPDDSMSVEQKYIQSQLVLCLDIGSAVTRILIGIFDLYLTRTLDRQWSIRARDGTICTRGRTFGGYPGVVVSWMDDPIS